MNPADSWGIILGLMFVIGLWTAGNIGYTRIMKKIVARKPEWSPIYHYASGTQVRRITWKVTVEMISTGAREACCDSHHGHATKQNAAKCLDRKLRKVIAESAD